MKPPELWQLLVADSLWVGQPPVRSSLFGSAKKVSNAKKIKQKVIDRTGKKWAAPNFLINAVEPKAFKSRWPKAVEKK